MINKARCQCLHNIIPGRRQLESSFTDQLMVVSRTADSGDLGSNVKVTNSCGFSLFPSVAIHSQFPSLSLSLSVFVRPVLDPVTLPPRQRKYKNITSRVIILIIPTSFSLGLLPVIPLLYGDYLRKPRQKEVNRTQWGVDYTRLIIRYVTSAQLFVIHNLFDRS